MAQTLLECLVQKNDPALVTALANSNARLSKGVGDLKIPTSFFSSSPKAADMLKFILFHSSRIFYSILSASHFELWNSFVECCRIFFSYELTNDLIDEVETRYEGFVADFIRLFPTVNVTYNLHVGLHITQTLRTFGPSYTSWWLVPSFFYDSYLHFVTSFSQLQFWL